jgi:L-sorbose 1-phosphate reductase
MPDTLDRYKTLSYDVPSVTQQWELYGVGLNNLGRDGEPVERSVPRPGPRELLVRTDACGICFSDVKIFSQGGRHPRLQGRDLQTEPVVMGHEVALTVVEVGEELRDRFRPGERYIVQADVYYQGRGIAYGYVLTGGFTQYEIIPPEIIEGDEGCYLLPVREETGYSEAALAEPWACVEASYRIPLRREPKPGGRMLIVNAAAGEWRLNGLLAARPQSLLFAGGPGAGASVEIALSNEDRVRGKVIELGDPATLAARAQEASGGELDDIVVLGTPEPALVEALQTALAKQGVLCICATEPMSRPTQVDVGRVHYWGWQFIGTTSRDPLDAYRATRDTELRADGAAWIIGAGGPLGQMHVQRALEMPNGPRLLVVSQTRGTPGRVEKLRERFAPLAERKGVRFACLSPDEADPDAFDTALRELAPAGFHDVVGSANAAATISQGSRHLADGGGLNIFAGIPVGTLADLDLSDVYLRNVRYWGSSGSRISDLRETLRKAEDGELSTNDVVAAVGGLSAVRDGLAAVEARKLPGKIVIYTQIADLPLTPIEDLAAALPSVAARLKDGRYWSREAEAELLRLKLSLER